jgi:hypothetical protein
MTRKLTTLAAAGIMAAAAMASSTPADARNGRIAAGIIGGLAAGAIIGGAFGAPYYGYYGGPYYAYAPGPYYYGGPCHWRRERVWTGWGWAFRRVRVCY